MTNTEGVTSPQPCFATCLCSPSVVVGKGGFLYNHVYMNCFQKRACFENELLSKLEV